MNQLTDKVANLERLLQQAKKLKEKAEGEQYTATSDLEQTKVFYIQCNICIHTVGQEI